MWSIDSLGWKGASAAEIRARVLSLAAPGAIALFHVGSASQDANALPGIIDGLRGDGFRLVPLAQVLPWWPLPNARSFATQQYRDFLDRAPSTAEVEYWNEALLSKTRSVGATLQAFQGSTEFSQNWRPILALYEASLGSFPDFGGYSYWGTRLRAHHDLAATAQAFLDTTELQGRYPAATSNEQFVTAVYRSAFHRDPDAGGLAYWVQLIASGRRTAGFRAWVARALAGVHRAPRP